MRTASVQDAVQRALNKVSYEALTGCWLWNGSYTNNRFGSLRYDGKTWKASRFLFTHLKEPISPGQYLLHYCDNEACVNPNHLRQGTQKDNMLDMKQRGRQNNKRPPIPKKLTKELVKYIRESTESGAKLAKKLSIAQQTVSDIRTHKTWK